MMPAPGPMTRAFATALKSAQIEPRDTAAVALARRYAQLLDVARGTSAEFEVYSDLGPKLLGALTALGMTQAGRGAKGGTGVSPVAAKLDEFTKRRARKHAS